MSALCKTALSLALTGIVPAIAADEAPRPFVHPLFSDHAVLQRDVVIAVWGWTAPGTPVKIEFAGQRDRVTARADGRWLARLAPMQASTQPRAMTISTADGSQRVVIQDLLVGDVWICSGQSNMEWPVSASLNADDEVARSSHPSLRLFQVAKKVAYTPEAVPQGTWTECNPSTIPGFSAVGYFFGRELNQRLGVPIGLVNSSWGGTIAEAWVSPASLQVMPEFRPALAGVKDLGESLKQGGPELLLERWYTAHDPGTSGQWQNPELTKDGWSDVQLPAEFEALGWKEFDGIAWFRRTVVVPSDWAGLDLELHFGAIDDIDTTWMNGVRVGSHDNWMAPRTYRVPASAVRPGTNTLAVRVLDTGGNGGLMGGKDQYKIFPVGKPEAALALDGAWQGRLAIAKSKFGENPPIPGNNPNTVTVLYNGMIAPLTGYGVRGAIWYQGESNADRAGQYRGLLPLLIRDWRARFERGDLAFHIVSLANFTATHPEPRDNDWAELRDAQAYVAKTMPNTGLALAIDIGVADDIHPRNKQEVGRRLALSALARTYGQAIPWSGPWYRSMDIQGGKIRLQFDYTEGGLSAKGGPLKGFAIAGDNRQFVWADAVVDGDTVVVSSPKVPNPKAVRYAWDANPIANLYNGAELPAVPFRTDDWPRKQ
ncbi:MAG: hypothetical protein IT581_02640 [Verrucomicrobiales bacterium]|nr:hypothetical protein [Verrucomicrobiales bacterium]